MEAQSATGAIVPFYRVHLISGDPEILYAHSEEQAQSIISKKLGRPEEEIQRVEYLKFDGED
jgi:hypothetical protein